MIIIMVMVYYLIAMYGDILDLARPGHLIYCYGNCNKDLDDDVGDSAEDEDSGEELLKKYWLELIERPSLTSSMFVRRKPPNKKLFTVRFCE